MSLTNSTNVMGFYVALLLFGASRAFMMPALQSILPQIIPRERLAQAIATNSMTVKIATISGPIIGGGTLCLCRRCVDVSGLLYRLSFWHFITQIRTYSIQGSA